MKRVWLTSAIACVLLMELQARAQAPSCAQPCPPGYGCELGTCAPICFGGCPSGQTCTAPRRCSTAPAPVAESTAAVCADGADNDMDGALDCADPECSLFVFCQARPSAPVVAAPQESPLHEPVFALHVNPGGAGTFGPSLSLEFGGIVTFQVFGRAMNAGLLNYVLANEHSTWADDEYVWGVGAGIALRVYISPGMRGMRGFWIGVASEYQANAWRKPGFYDEQTHNLVPTLQVGWRWIWGAFMFGVGASAGYRAELHSEVLYGPEACEFCREDVYDSTGAFYLVHLELGFAI